MPRPWNDDAEDERGDLLLRRRQEDEAILELRQAAIKAKSPAPKSTERDALDNWERSTGLRSGY